jgi:hypothetical protein
MENVVKINLKMEAIAITNALADSATLIITTVKSCTVQLLGQTTVTLKCPH